MTSISPTLPLVGARDVDHVVGHNNDDQVVDHKHDDHVVDGIVVIDKPGGMTSHDVVERIRRVLRQPSVGHAGTLDPMATGVLVVALGEGTKLVKYLQADRKTYVGTIKLGSETNTLDADGVVVAESPVPPLTEAAVVHAIAQFGTTFVQQVPKVSAVKVNGKALHKRVREGEEIEPPSRQVTLHRCLVDRVSNDEIAVEIECSKGFYVRSFARDLAYALGTVGHLSALRRTVSGPFDLSTSVAFGEGPAFAEAIRASVVSVEVAARSLMRVVLDDVGSAHAKSGRLIPLDCVLEPECDHVALRAPTSEFEPLALFSDQGVLIAVARTQSEDEEVSRAGAGVGLRVLRGFALRSANTK